MPFVKCGGVNIEFPFEPYACQHDYMSKVVQCLQNGTNAILESPTGTGKTLCLLCSTLAWRNTYIAQQELGRCLQGNENSSEADEGGFRDRLAADLKQGAGSWNEGQEGMFLDRPKIIYASRTHSQLSQAVNQLKDTPYRPRVSVIGSREQLCIHPEVQKAESNAAKVHMCRAKVDGRMCNFYNNLDQKKANKAFTDSILDIEDLVKLGNTHKVCPYYMARELKANADIVFMPYNYLLDSKSRRIHGVELQGNVVIFDEAHNVERMCEESTSFDLTSYDLASCVEETGHLLKNTIEVEVGNQQFRSESAEESEFSPSALAILKKIFLDLEVEIENMKPPQAGLTKPGGFIYELLAKVHITFDSKAELIQLLEKIISHLTTSSSVFHNKAAGLQKFCDIMNTIFSRESPSEAVAEANRCYKVHIHASAPQKKGRADLWTSKNPAKAKKQGHTLSYWCFSPGFSMKNLVAQGIRTIILTSGTLSPLSSFKSELQIDFSVQLENPHVISSHQMTVAVVTKGPDGVVLNSSYNTRFNKDYTMSLGNAIVNFARLVPNGLLVFFPSYTVMNHALEQWQELGIHQRISQYKEVFVEPKGKVDFVQAMASFYEKINDPKLNGACFFAVCRGKVSEGLDFADINGRAVVITGLPFPPRMDPRVVLKMQYLDESRRRNQSSLSGPDWYRQQASRAVNQAIGRVIRHKEDFGAILLCDTRFSSKESRGQLPAWVRPYLKVYDQFGKGIRDLINFFKEAEKTMPKPKAKQVCSSGPVLVDQAQCLQLPASGPSSSSSSGAPPVKAKYIDTHVPSLKRNRDGSHISEAQLKIMYEGSRTKPAKKAVGLLDALNSVENSPRLEDDIFLTQRNSESMSQKTSLLRQQDKKKKRIVIKQQNGLSASSLLKTTPQPPKDKSDSARSSSPVPAADQLKTKDSCQDVKLAPAQEYIAKVKKTLSLDSYKTFSNIMRTYRQSGGFGLMVTGIADLFTEDESKYPLFRNFYTFIPPHHKKDFHQVCVNLTGQGCGYKPEHSIQPKKLQKVKPKAPTTSVNLKSEVGTEPCQGEPRLPSAARDMATSKTGDPSKRNKYESTNPSTSIIGNVDSKGKASMSSRSVLHENKAPKTSSVPGTSVSQDQKIQPSAGSVTAPDSEVEEKLRNMTETSVSTEETATQNKKCFLSSGAVVDPPSCLPGSGTTPASCMEKHDSGPYVKSTPDVSSAAASAAAVDDDSDSNPTADTNVSPVKHLDPAEKGRMVHPEIPQGTTDQVQLTLLRGDPCNPEESGQGEDSQNEDEEEPMSLESNTGDDVMDASMELFEDSFSQNKTFQKDQANLALASIQTSLDPETSERGSGPQGDCKQPAEEDSTDGAFNHQTSESPLLQGSKRLKMQKMIKYAKRSIGLSSGPVIEEKNGGNAREPSQVNSTKKGSEENKKKDAIAQSEFESLSRPQTEVLQETEKDSLIKHSDTKKLPKNHSQLNVCPSREDTECLTLHKLKSKSSDSPRFKLSVSKGESLQSKHNERKKKSLDCSQVTLSRKRLADGSVEVLQKEKHRKREVKSERPTSKLLDKQKPCRDDEVMIVEERNQQAKDSEGKSTSKKLITENREIKSSSRDLVDSSQQTATLTSEKTKLRSTEHVGKRHRDHNNSPDVKRHQRLSKKASKHSGETHKAGPQKKTEVKVADPTPRSTKQSLIDQSASYSHTKTKSVCALCKRGAWPAYKAPCNHVCCQTCWQEYIREFDECPDCSAQTKEKDLVAM